MSDFTGVKVFSATKALERETLGERITDWLRANQNINVIDKIVTQSSDNAFHMIAITIFYGGQLGAATGRRLRFSDNGIDAP